MSVEDRTCKKISWYEREWRRDNVHLNQDRTCERGIPLIVV